MPRIKARQSKGATLDAVIEGTFTPTNDADALLDEIFADFFEEELFEEA
ncbi:MAG: hypothetical protein IJL92_02795 [Thermoguttaceae bacterium]|nr:hypothetical protein [Thermoguttaceae bacterium]